MNIDSYIQVSAKLAHGRALLKLEEIKARRSKAWKERIVEEQARRGRARFWMPWLKPLSTEQAIRRIHDESINFGRVTPDCIGWEQEQRCKRVLSLARAVMDDELVAPLVMLSSEDLEHISWTP